MAQELLSLKMFALVLPGIVTITTFGCTSAQKPPPTITEKSTWDAFLGIDEDADKVANLRTWRGNYPVAKLGLLPAGQTAGSVGYISSDTDFAAIWRAFITKEQLPTIDFSRDIVVFSRNTAYYNSTMIHAVSISNGTAKIHAMETLSAIPIQDHVCMAFAVIPRAGVKFIQAGSEKISL